MSLRVSAACFDKKPGDYEDLKFCGMFSPKVIWLLITTLHTVSIRGWLAGWLARWLAGSLALALAVALVLAAA